ncbi:adenosine deaminase [Hirschia litorea]|uniref:adenosine deaminase n=1 Tax=Hirschia litorea TaxID=1199156 RepID=A0ABW2IHN9_9PROT
MRKITRHNVKHSLAFLALSIGCSSFNLSFAEVTRSGKTAGIIFDRIMDDPVELRVFLREMPKGGDLHNHLTGSPYAEEYLEWASDREYCIDTKEGAIKAPPCELDGVMPAKNLSRTNPEIYAAIVKSISMKGFIAGNIEGVSGHDKFFNSFALFDPIAAVEPGKSIASVRRAASRDNALYLEIIYNPKAIDDFTFQTNDPQFNGDDLAGAFSRFEPFIANLVSEGIEQTNIAEEEAKSLLRCETSKAEKACRVEVRYNGYSLRVLTPDKVFRQLALNFALAHADERFQGVTLVAPEDAPNALKDYKLHMEMVAFLSKQFPDVSISLHAGELVLGDTPSSALAGNIEDAVLIAGSQRIGHGTDIAFETNALETLETMARKNIAVEVSLTSNEKILGVQGADHPINLYLKSKVPVVLSTDDQGVLRIDLTEEYVRAAYEHKLDYRALKHISRNSLEYAFIAGDSIWEDQIVGGKLVPACQKDNSEACIAFVEKSPKARLQLKLEKQFDVFEDNIVER